MVMEKQLHIKRGQDMYPQIYEFYYNKIRFGDYKAGDRLPTYKHLAEQYAVSESTIKMAYKQLERNGYVRLNSKGTFVTEQTKAVSAAISECLEESIQTAQLFGAGEEDIFIALEYIFEKYGRKGEAHE